MKHPAMGWPERRRASERRLAPRRAVRRGRWIAKGAGALCVVLTALAAPAHAQDGGPVGAAAFAENCVSPDLALEDAIGFCSRALSAGRESGRLTPRVEAQILLNRGAALADLGRLDSALADFDAAIERDATVFEIWPNRGWTLLRLERPAEAARSFERALSVRPDDLFSRLGRGAAFIAGSAPAEGLRDVEAVLRENPEILLAHYQRGLGRLGLGETAEAVAAFGEVLARDPSHLAARMQRARLLEASDVAAAEADYRAALDAAPEHAELRYRYGRFLDAAGRLDEADAELMRAWRLGWRDEWLHERVLRMEQ